MSKNKRAIGYVKKLEEGKYLLRVSCGFDEFGRRVQPARTVYCTSDREAEKLLMDFYNEQQNRAQVKNPSIPVTLEDLYVDWMENHVKIGHSQKTIDFYEALWKNHLKKSEKLKIKTAASKTINKIVVEIELKRTRNAVFKMLKAMFNKAVMWGYLSANPCDKVKTPSYRPKIRKTLTEKQMQIIMEALPKEETKYQVIFYLAGVCGMRRQEIVGLEWSPIDFEEHSFVITNNLKTDDSERTLYFPDELTPILLRLMNEQKRQKQIAGDKWAGGDWVFTQWNGEQMCVQTPSHWWKKFADRLGIKDVTFHGLRHTAATYMIKNNVPVSTVSGILGHAQISTTVNTYTHVIEDTKKAAINIMSNVYHSCNAEGKEAL